MLAARSPRDWVAVVELATGEIREGSTEAPSPEWLGAFLSGSRSAASLSGFDTGCDDVAWAPLPARTSPSWSVVAARSIGHASDVSSPPSLASSTGGSAK